MSLMMEKLAKEVIKANEEIMKFKNRLSQLDREKELLNVSIDKLERFHLDTSVKLKYIEEIYRLAKYQFSRLNKKSEQILTIGDVQELEKWIGRTKSDDGLKDIIRALREIDKFSPSQIRSNLYALVQKIIIEGPYEPKRPK